MVMSVANILKVAGKVYKTAKPDETIRQLAQHLKEQRNGAMVVTPDGVNLVGIISERDIAFGLAKHGEKVASMKVSDLMPSDATTETLYTPACVKPGVQSNVPLPSPLSVKDAPAGTLNADKAGVVASGSVAVTLNVRNTFSVVLCGATPATTGAWLPASWTAIATTSESAIAPSVVMKVTL